MRILVLGVVSFDAGKTAIVRTLLAAARDRGLDAVAAKPRSGHHDWIERDHSRWCAEQGRLVSRDARHYADVMADPPPLEALNPAHQVVAPVDLRRAGELARSDLDAEEVLVAERVTDPDDGTTLWLAPHLDRAVVVDGLVDAVRDRADAVRRLDAPTQVAEQARRAVRARLDRLAGAYEHVIVEGQSDDPAPAGLDPSRFDVAVAAAGPLAFVLDPDRLAEARRVGGVDRGPELLRYVEPGQVVEVPELAPAERGDPDRLAGALGDLVEAVWG